MLSEISSRDSSPNSSSCNRDKRGRRDDLKSESETDTKILAMGPNVETSDIGCYTCGCYTCGKLGHKSLVCPDKYR